MPLLDPRNSWPSAALWQENAEILAHKFISNFEQYTDTDTGKALVLAGPVVK